MAIVKPVILEGGQLKTAGVGDQVPQAYVQGLDTSLATKVDKEAGKGLSDTNFTQVEKTKLNDVAVGATKNRVDALNADKVHTHTTAQVTGLDTTLAGKADKTTQVIAGTGLTGGGTLAANRTLTVSYGSAAGTAAQGNDSRLSNSREWTAETLTQAEAEAGTATTRRAFTAQRVRQAIVAWFNSVSGALGRTILTRTTAAQVRGDIGLGTAATKDVGESVGNVVEVGAFGLGYAKRAEDFSERINSGFFLSTAGTVGMPTGMVPDGGWMINVNWSYNNVGNRYNCSFYGNVQSNFIGFRRIDNNGVPQAPVELHHTGNLLQTTGTSTAFPMSQKTVTDALSGKVDKVLGYSLLPNTEITRLATMATSATKNRADSDNADKVHTHTTAQVTGLDAALVNKVDKVAGKGLSDTNFTQAEKAKLSSLEGSKFVGLFVSESALPATGSDGDYANVDGGIGSDVYRVIWDSSDNKWVRAQGVSTALMDSQIKQQYESNPDTNAFTDDEKEKLANVANNATANRPDSANADKVHTHTTAQVTGLDDALSSKASTTDPRLSDSREWTAATVSQAEAQAGTATTARKWTAQRVAQAISAIGLKIGTTASTAKAGNWTPTWSEVTSKPSSFTPAAHNHSAGEITSGVLAYARIPTIRHGETNFANQDLNTGSSVQHATVRTGGATDDGTNSLQVDGGTRTDTLAAGGVQAAEESIDTDGNVQVRGEGQLKMGDFAIQYNATTQSLDFNFVGN